MDNIVVESKPAPPSPAAAPVRLSDYMEELLRFTLSASFPEDYDAPLGLPQEYCNNLLREDPSPFPFSNLHGVPAYPLYKHLARALEGCISSGTFFRELRSAEGVREDEFLMMKRTELDRLIMEKGTELVNMMGDVEFDLHVQEPFFSQLRNGLKTVEGRCATGDYNRYSSCCGSNESVHVKYKHKSLRSSQMDIVISERHNKHVVSLQRKISDTTDGFQLARCFSSINLFCSKFRMLGSIVHSQKCCK